MDYQGISIDLEAETKAIVKFLEQYWDIDESGEGISSLVNDILQKGIDYGIASQERDYNQRFQGYKPHVTIINDLGKAVGVRLDHNVKFEMTGDPSNLRYETEDVATSLSGKPKEYGDFLRQYRKDDNIDDPKVYEFDGFTDFDRTVNEEFKFPEVMNREALAYQEIAQGVSPTQSMVYAIFLQGKYLGKGVVRQKHEESFQEFDNTILAKYEELAPKK